MTDARQCKECGKPPSGKRAELVRGRCSACYQRWLKAQKQSGSFVSRNLACPVSERLKEKSAAMPNGCIRWTGFVHPSGYGLLDIGGRSVRAHRAAYEEFVGPIPDGAELDHTCHNRDQECAGGGDCLHRRCINPDHLEPVTRRQNQERSRHTKTGRVECSKGHPLTPENLFIRADGRRFCKKCSQSRYHELTSAPPAEAIREFCRNGHAMTEANTYVRGKLTICRTCRRERMREARARSKGA